MHAQVPAPGAGRDGRRARTQQGLGPLDRCQDQPGPQENSDLGVRGRTRPLVVHQNRRGSETSEGMGVSRNLEGEGTDLVSLVVELKT